MASESGGKKVASFSSMRQPPLTKQLKKILSEYPDGGQIIKELVQNAEDAGATKVELICDERDLKTELYDRRHEDYNKFFEGQALCVYNDAVFTVEDWEGIRMIDSSVKEDDRLKVGRFGQGFKSVFHLTDYPCILSGDTLLLVDPQQQRDKVNAMMEVKSLQEYEGIDIDAFLNAFEGMFGITRDLTRNGTFPGTLFRFPLRRMPSELSSNTYSREKLLELFEIFEGEASSVLLFLRNLECISLHVRTNDRRTNILTGVKISNIQEIKRPRSTFNGIVSSLPKSYRGSPIPCCLNLVIEYNNYQRGKQKTEISRWIVVNYFMGGNASEEFQSLIEDPELQLSPYVGVAAPVDQTVDKFDGHVFCFLPLPKEGAKLTGLPVHVNGYFALNQSRHHLKWATDEQIGHSVSEKAICWNEKLIQEALPLAYKVWFEKAVEYSSQNANNEKIVSNVHRAFPDVTLVQPNWSSMLGPLFTQLKTLGILFSLTNRWVYVQNAYLIDEDALNKADYKDTIIKTARLLDIDCVVVNKACYNALSNNATVHASHFTPSLLASKLRQRNIFPSLNDREKLHILEYLLTDRNTEVLKGVPLLPLQSGKWTQFMPSSRLQDSCIYMASSQQISLCPGMEDRFIRQALQLPDDLQQHLQRLCERGEFQIRMLQSKDFETLLEKLLQQTFPLRAKRRLKSSTLSIDWLKAVWQYLLQENKVSLCKIVPLFPLLEGGNWNNPDVVLICLTQNVILKETGKNRLPEEVFCCLKALDIDVITNFPPWIPSSKIEHLIQKPNPESVSDVLASIAESGKSEEKIGSFNNCNETNRFAFMQYMTGIQAYAPGVGNLLRKFQMFRERSSYNGKANMTSLHENDVYISFKDFPVQYPLSCLDGYDQAQQEMLRRFGGKEMQLHEMLRQTFDAIKRSKYPENDVKIVMTYFVSHYRTLQYTVKEHFVKLVVMAKEIPFLMCSKGLKRPSDLFNPLVLELQELFTGQDDVFPKFTYTPDQETINIYQDLGLKSEKHVTATDLLHIARLLDKWSQTSEHTGQTVCTKSRALVHHLSSHTEILREKCEGREMKTLLENISFIEFERNRPPSYPSWMPWFTQNSILCKPREAKSSRMQFLVGSVMPTVAHTSQELDSAFGWQKDPLSSQVICQLMNVSKHHGKKEKKELLVLLGHLYEWLCQCNEIDFGQLRNEAIVWNGEGFSQPTHIVINEATGDVNLRPYFYFIPDTIQEYTNFFARIGCHSQQSIPLLIQTLSLIQNQTSINQELNLDQRFKVLALQIVEKLAQRCNEIPEGSFSEILIPLRTENESPLMFKPISDCTYDRNPESYIEEEDDGPIHFVHERISEDVARKLNIKSVLKTRLSDTEELGIEEWGQNESLTDRIKSLLEGYRDGLSIPKELIQNADDAGATTVEFLYDERENLDARRSLLHAGMKICQGPALWVHNDSKFSEEDFRSIIKLNGATKRENSTTIGKFGVGFCSVYNLTDVPSFISGSNIIMFDPQKTHLLEALPGNSPGMKIDLKRAKNRKLIRKHRDQFKPYDDVFGCNIFQDNVDFNGTLFRFPLRTSEESLSSEMCSVHYSKKEMSDLLQLFFKTAGNLLLFVQNIQSVKFYHLAENASSPKQKCMLFSVSRQFFQNEVFQLAQRSILSKVSSSMKHFSQLQQVNIEIHSCTENCEKLLKCSDLPKDVTVTWLISWATGTRESMRESQLHPDKKSALPLSAVAVPVQTGTSNPIALDHPSVTQGFYRVGHLFCFLPMPIETNLCFHLHGCFEISSDRRQLAALTEDDKCTTASYWNDCLLADASVNAFIDLLLFLSHNAGEEYVYHQLWPKGRMTTEKSFKQSFYRELIRRGKLFKGFGRWASFDEIVYLDKNIRENEEVGEIANCMAAKHFAESSKIYVDVPKALQFEIEEDNPGMLENIRRNMITETHLVDILHETLQGSFWDGNVKSRDEMLLYMLNSNNDDILQKLKESKCIPCEELDTLCLPRDLVHPKCDLTALFLASDGRFPSKVFFDQSTLEKLTRLGMMNDYLGEDILLERCKSISELSSKCCNCAFMRIKALTKYLSKRDVQEKLESEKTVIDEIRKDVWVLPVLSRPSNWPFPWFADTCDSLKHFKSVNCPNCCLKGETSITLAKPAALFQQEYVDYLGVVELILNETVLYQPYRSQFGEMLSFLHVKGAKYLSCAFDKLVEQLGVITDTYYEQDSIYDLVKGKVEKLYDRLQQIITSCQSTTDRENYEQQLNALQDKRVVLIGKTLFYPRQVACSVSVECFPDINRLPATEKICRGTIYSLIGVQQVFSSNYIIELLTQKKQKWGEQKCDEAGDIVKLLTNLHGIMKANGETYEQFSDVKQSIVAPDVDGILRPTFSLIVDDTAYVARPNMFILHDSLPTELALALGVKTKRKRIANMISKGIPFGQKEDLVIRIKGLLKAYPRDESVLKELLQNADDAGATELHFIKDYRTHCPDGILINDKFQGPALCVFNDSYFTESDLEGIHNLGYGSKKLDLMKTGQYGVGFNAVYHLTDTPSFMSKGPTLGNGGVLCIFDPTCNNIEDIDKTEPGMRYDINDVKQDFPCELLGFSECDIFQTDIGTMFRFPLRKEQSPLSDDVIDAEAVNRMLSIFADELKESLLFLKNIKSIKISDITSGQLKTEYSVSRTMSAVDNQKKNKFTQDTNKWAAALQAVTTSHVSTIQSKVLYVETLTDSKGFTQTWLIVQKLGASSYPDSIVNDLQNNSLCHLPVGGIALPFTNFKETANTRTDSQSQADTTPKPFSGKAFAVLPLPVNTGLPAHVNGHFALDHESRRDLWKEGSRLKWNEFLRKHVIVPCLVSAISYFTQYFIPEHENHIVLKSWKQMNRLMKLYHNMFPVETGLTEEFWKHLIRDFYEYVQKNECPIFPVINTDQFKNLIAVWVPLQKSSRKFSAVFNCISKYLPTCCINRQRIRYELERIFKALGMQLVQTPRCVFDTIKCVVAEISVSDPSFVMTFLSTFREKEPGTCVIGEVECDISTTKFLEPAILKEIVAYITEDEHFMSKMTGLPIILTADGKVRECSAEYPVIHSEYLELLPNSADKFLHKILQPVLWKNELYEAGILKPLDIPSFLSMLPESAPALHRNCSFLWNKNDPVSQNWLLCLYKFLYSQSLEKATAFGTQHLNSQQFCSNFEHFEGWAIVPSVKKGGDTDIFELVPADKAFSVINDSGLETSVNGVIQMLNIPVLDKSVFDEEDKRHVELIHAVSKSLASTLKTHKRHYELINAVSKGLASTLNPYKLLQCLLFNKEHMLSCNIPTEKALDLLNFFDRSLENLKRINDIDLQGKLKLLPLFTTQQNSVISLTDWSEVIVLNGELPIDGIAQWTSSTGIVLLRQSEKVENLYVYLQLKQLSLTDLYISFILPRFDNLPHEFWLIHIEYVRDNLLRPDRNRKYSQIQKHLIELLKRVPFVCVNGVMKRADQLYDYDLLLFQCMLHESMFPPETFRSYAWKKVLLLLGLNSEASESQILEFAQAIETEGVHAMDSNLLQKSHLVLQRFIELCNSYPISDHTLERLGTIRFILPKQVQTERIELARQYDGGLKLISFDASVAPKWEILCWTCMNILPDCAMYMSENILSKLGVYKSPPVEQVILHCQIISEALIPYVRMFHSNERFVLDLLEHVYGFLMRNLQSHAAMMKTRLQFTPVIYLPHDKNFVNGSSVVIDLREEDEIKPYLYKAPSEFGKYKKFFVAIGAQDKVTCNHYISVLAQLQQSVGDEELSVRDLVIAADAIQKLLFMITSDNAREICLPTLFLPDKSKKLKKSTELVMCDNYSILERIQNADLNLNLFIGCLELGIYKSNPKQHMLLLPEALQPQFLTSVIKEKVVTDHLTIDEYCRSAQQIEDFVHSEELLEGILRILHHQNHTMNGNFGEILRENLQSVNIRRARGIETVCCYNGNVISGSEQHKSCFIQDGNGENRTILLYFQADSEDRILDVILERDGLINLIERFVGTYLINIRLLTQILRQYGTPDAVTSVLDREQITDYHLLSSRHFSAFPRPGTYVEERFHPFLEHDIRPFDKQEYRCVALELEDEALENEENDIVDREPVFIYVRIVRLVDDRNSPENDIRLQYLVDTGGMSQEPVAVPIFCLYRFVRPQVETSVEIEAFDQQPPRSLSFDENCRRLETMIKEAWNLPTQDRKKIQKRLMLKWHPDKNPNDQKYCTDVFQFILSVIEHLESETDTDTTDGRNSSTYHRMSENINRRATAYARAYHSNIDEYNRSNFTGQYSHTRQTKRPDHAESRRWLQQAKNDFRAADLYFPDVGTVDGFNWTCYMCHQACEKALKAASYNIDANSVLFRTHSLFDVASGLGNPVLIDKASQLEDTLGQHTRMRYPDSISRSKIPSQVYSEADARFSLSIVREVIDIVDEMIG